MSKKKYRSATWQENTLKSLYYAFATSEQEGLKLSLNLVDEIYYKQPSFLVKLYNTVNEVKEEGIYDISEETLERVAESIKNPGKRDFDFKKEHLAKLSFGFYRALFDELDSYETHFLQLQRDYARELRGERMLFAVDFSELHDYIHSASKGAHRAAINQYILNTSNDKFSILPGAVGELLTDLEKTLPEHFRTEFTRALLAYPAVVQFRSGFSEAVQNEERLINLYADAEAELKGAMGEIFDVLVYGRGYTSIQALQNLFDTEKLAPIEGVQQIGPLLLEDKARARLVEDLLTLSRPEMTENNQIDAADFIIALLLNQRGDPSNKRYITIYSQAISLIRACRSHESLQWENDYLIREANYLKFRTKLQEFFPASIEQRYKYIVEGCQLCQKLKIEISKLVDIDEYLQQEAIEPSLKLLDLYRRFDEEYRQPLSFREEIRKKSVTIKQARKLYDTLRDESRFAGIVQDAYEVLKEHLRKIKNNFQAFSPVSTNIANIQAYRANLRRRLRLEIV